MRYFYTHTATQAATGFFTCRPDPSLSLADCLVHLAAHPLDDFMRRHLLQHLAGLPAEEVATALAAQAHAPACAALACELRLVSPELARCLNPANFPLPASAEAEATSLALLGMERLPDKEVHAAWNALYADNIQGHRALPAPDKTGLPELFPEPAAPGLPCLGVPFTACFPLSLAAVQARHTATPGPAYVRPSTEETAALAEERLAEAGILAGVEKRHTSSLSPVALLRPWNVSLRVRLGRHDFSLKGEATTYGRGLSVAAARASCLMEMVERASAYLPVTEEGVENRTKPAPLLRARLSELRASGRESLDPNDFPLEVAYADAPLYWMPGHAATGREMLVPVQMAGLFCNLDEIRLFESPGSTGLATGNTLEEAKVAALLEIIERDAEAVTPFAKSGCFVLEAREARLAALLKDYTDRGINVHFQDLTGPLGVPVYQCFVMSPKGTVARGYGAGLSGQKAALSALTETPFPYPDGGFSGPQLRNLPRRVLEELPDWSLESPSRNLAMLEELLAAAGRAPVYVELSRADLGFPVVRAFVPGFELAADRDLYSRVPWRLYRNHERMWSG